MNCLKAQREMLLGASGELEARRLARLDEHLAACAHCRAYQASLPAVSAAAARSLPTGVPSAAVMERIRAAAAERNGRRPLTWGPRWEPLSPFGRSVRLLAYAAALAVLLGGGWLAGRPGYRVERIRECSAILRAVTEEVVRQTGTGSSQETAEDLRGLAQQLLEMQELSGDFSDEELTSLDAAPPATAPLSHSTVGLRATARV